MHGQAFSITGPAGEVLVVRSTGELVAWLKEPDMYIRQSTQRKDAPFVSLYIAGEGNYT